MRYINNFHQKVGCHSFVYIYIYLYLFFIFQSFWNQSGHQKFVLSLQWIIFVLNVYCSFCIMGGNWSLLKRMFKDFYHMFVNSNCLNRYFTNVRHNFDVNRAGMPQPREVSTQRTCRLHPLPIRTISLFFLDIISYNKQ